VRLILAHSLVLSFIWVPFDSANGSPSEKTSCITIIIITSIGFDRKSQAIIINAMQQQRERRNLPQPLLVVHSCGRDEENGESEAEEKLDYNPNPIPVLRPFVFHNQVSEYAA
jgi:hypothetical protein